MKAPRSPSPLPLPSLATTVLYIYNEIQIRISRTVSMPRVTLWILLTLISWIMLIFTLFAHRQQTPHDMGVVTLAAVTTPTPQDSVCISECAPACLLKWLPCCQTDLHEKGWSNYITYVNEKCTQPSTYIHIAEVKKTVQAAPLLTNTGWHHHLSEIALCSHCTQKLQAVSMHTTQINQKWKSIGQAHIRLKHSKCYWKMSDRISSD